MTQIKSRKVARRKPATTNDRNFRTFLLVSQLEAKAIGARIAQARNEQGMTQEEMCELTTFSKRSLSDYENGVTIPYKHLREISALLSRPVEFFLHGEPEATGASAESLVSRLEALEALTTTGFQALEAAIEQLADELRPPGQADNSQ